MDPNEKTNQDINSLLNMSQCQNNTMLVDKNLIARLLMLLLNQSGNISNINTSSINEVPINSHNRSHASDTRETLNSGNPFIRREFVSIKTKAMPQNKIEEDNTEIDEKINVNTLYLNFRILSRSQLITTIFIGRMEN